jgi:hypothetical protein
MVIMRNKWAAILVGALSGIAVAGAGLAQAASIGWETRGAFQVCLEAEAQKWLDAKVALVVNDDPAAGNMDDATVAGWATGALKSCAANAGSADAASEQQFMRYMAHWRDHIYRAAQDLRRRDRPD